ncbi:MAG: recombinase family protein [Ruminococcus sp.]|nr:recombinase family protein [Ruminiclostridium sp.]MBP3797403.1 recombinase family protein [Ruminococcus sp.]
MTRQSTYNVGIYVRLSQEDMREGESLSIENQKKMLTDYVSQQTGWNLVGIYEDDGYSGTNFDRPGVRQLLDDAKSGKINLILCKDLSRFGRNYIEVGQYIDYIFPSFNIRFIALSDNVDTLDRNSTAMDLMPIMNLFNEWHAANTSKKVRSVLAQNAKEGKYIASFAAYGYLKGDDEKHTPIIDEPAAKVVRRIFELRATGITPTQIAKILNAEGVPIPSDYRAQRLGKPNPYKNTFHYWSHVAVRNILGNPIYIGHLAQQKFTTVSFKNHKSVRRGKDEWVIAENTHEPIISQELWDKCQEVDRCASHGKIMKKGIVLPLNSMMFCPDCGAKMKLNGHAKKKDGSVNYFYACGTYSRCGASTCTTHYISRKQIEKIVLADILAKARYVIENEEEARQEFLRRKETEGTKHLDDARQQLAKCQSRLADLKTMTQKVYQDKLLGKVPEDLCLETLSQFRAEEAELTEKVKSLTAALEQDSKARDDIEEFICRLKQYADAPELTREMCIDLIEYVVIGDRPKDKSTPRRIQIYYKFLDNGLVDGEKPELK